MHQDSDDDVVFVRDQPGHRHIRETPHCAALSDTKRREKAARLRSLLKLGSDALSLVGPISGRLETEKATTTVLGPRPWQAP
jgi:hypothetical protein